MRSGQQKRDEHEVGEDSSCLCSTVGYQVWVKQVGHLSQFDIPLSGTGLFIEQQLMSVGVIAFDVSVCKSPLKVYSTVSTLYFLTQMFFI